MLRNSFTQESALLGSDFTQRLEEVGGKAAGLELMVAGLARHKHSSDFVVPQYAVVPTSFYERSEQLFDELLGDPLAFYAPRASGVDSDLAVTPKESLPEFAQLRALDGISRHPHLLLADARVNELFTEMNTVLAQRFPSDARNGGGTFHLRSSSTSEDFRDDRYYGTFETQEAINFFHSPIQHLLRTYVNFYLMKRFGDYALPADEKLACILMRTARGTSARLIISYSRYPEDTQGDTVLEVSEKTLDLLLPRHLIFSGKTTVVHQANHKLEYVNPLEWEDEIAGQPSVVSMSDVERIRDVSKFFEDSLGYPVNMEWLLTREWMYGLQLRPVPALSPDRPVKELGPVPEGLQVVAETPFVIGSYRHTARLVQPSYKNGYAGHAFSEPVIMWHTEEAKGMRFYFSDTKCLALLNPYMGAALTHEHSIVPALVSERERFAFMGVPELGPRLARILTDVREEASAYPGLVCKYSPFPITVESDGRRGRLLVPSTYAHVLSK
jgi:hypothetical protein